MQIKSKIIKLLTIIVVFFIFLFFLYQRFFWHFFVRDGQLINLVLKNNFFSFQGQDLLVEVVKDPRSISKGLSNRDQLQTVTGQEIDGMLFVFPSSETKYFWMKDMNFDIDICWLNRGVLLDCSRQALKPSVGVDTSQLLFYQSPQAVDIVLETKPDFLSEEVVGAKLYKNLF
jgi:uncharacterized membrane protein (UPF0127 family)